MKLLAVLLTVLLALPMLAAADSTACINSTFQSTTVNSVVVIDGAPLTVETTDADLCPDGCSTTLSACRYNPLTQTALTFIALLAFTVMIYLGAHLADSFEGIDIVFYILTAAFSVGLTGLDVFSGIFRTIFLVVTFVPVALTILTLIGFKKEKADE